MNAVRLGIIGAGTMGAFHAESVSRSDRAELVVIADVRQGAAESLARQFLCEGTQDVSRTLTRDDLDGIVIATPMDTHVELIEQAARNAIAVLCEKPLARTIEECQRAIAIAEQCRIPLQVGFHRRFDPDWQQVHDAISAGRLGEIRVVKSTLRDMTPPPAEYVRTSGGYFLDAFVHDFDAARWLVGELASVTAVGATTSQEFSELDDYDSAVVVVEFVGGALGILDGSRVGGYGYECTTEVLGSEGTMRIGNPSASNIAWLHRGAMEASFPSTFLERFAAAYAREIDGFADIVKDGAMPIVGGHDALMALAVANAASLSARRGERVLVAEILDGVRLN